MDEIDVDCASCGYAIRDFTNVVAVSCGHGVIHYNCSYFNNECSVCDETLTAGEPIQFRPRGQNEENLKAQLEKIGNSLCELKSILEEQKQQQVSTTKAIEELGQQLKAKDEKITELQKEIYELKLEKVENLKTDLLEKLNNLG